MRHLYPRDIFPRSFSRRISDNCNRSRLNYAINKFIAVARLSPHCKENISPLNFPRVILHSADFRFAFGISALRKNLDAIKQFEECHIVN